MKAVLQRVQYAKVSVAQQVVGKIDKGLLIFLGVQQGDTMEDLDYLVKKIAQIRIFSDENGKMNLSCLDVNGDFLVVSQFTLLANTHRGNRPSYIESAAPDIAKKMYEDFTNSLAQFTHKNIQNGIFGADMQIELLNDGPVTILLDSRNKSLT